MTKQSDANAQEIAALKARIEELEKATAPEPPVDMTGFQRYDPTAGMSMPRSVLEEMAAAVPTAMVKGIALRDNRAPTGPCGMTPSVPKDKS
jgi:hypothetical protein